MSHYSTSPIAAFLSLMFHSCNFNPSVQINQREHFESLRIYRLKLFDTISCKVYAAEKHIPFPELRDIFVL